jgi:hypothetical protein
MHLSALEQHHKIFKNKKRKKDLESWTLILVCLAFFKLINFFLKIGSKKLSPFNRKFPTSEN